MPAKKAAGSGDTWKWVGGIVTILLGLGVWFAYLTLEQFFGIVFVLVGLKKLFWGKCSCCH